MIKPKIKFFDVGGADVFDIEWWNKHGFISNWCVVGSIHSLELQEFDIWLAMVINHE